MSTEAVQTNRGRRQLLTIIALFLIPPIAAFVAWKQLDSLSGVQDTTNAGTLIHPARPLQLDAIVAKNDDFSDKYLKSKWTYVIFAGDQCDALCEKQLYLTRQTRISVNKDIHRVQRLLVMTQTPNAAFSDQLKKEQTDLNLLVFNSNQANSWLDAFRGDFFSDNGKAYFLVDPLGNLMMHYDANVIPKAMLKDLKKLLKISQVG